MCRAEKRSPTALNVFNRPAGVMYRLYRVSPESHCCSLRPSGAPNPVCQPQAVC
jgi:hypothetical protein